MIKNWVAIIGADNRSSTFNSLFITLLSETASALLI
jgi:hypothetical protein